MVIFISYVKLPEGTIKIDGVPSNQTMKFSNFQDTHRSKVNSAGYFDWLLGARIPETLR